jgi:hypothetical protein
VTEHKLWKATFALVLSSTAAFFSSSDTSRRFNEESVGDGTDDGGVEADSDMPDVDDASDMSEDTKRTTKRYKYAREAVNIGTTELL